MLDCNRLMGFVFHSSCISTFKEIKQSLIDFVGNLEDDDAAVIMESYCYGKGELTAGFANAKQLANEIDFMESAKILVKAFAESDGDSPKFIFIISDTYSPEYKRIVNKLDKINAAALYPSQLRFVDASSEDIHMCLRLELGDSNGTDQ